MGKVPKMAVLRNVAPVNLKTEKNDIAYHVEKKILKLLPSLL